MPLKRVLNYKVIEPDYSYSTKYWPQLSKLIKDKYGEEEITDAVTVQLVLKDAFSFLCAEFIDLLKKKPQASFFVFVQDIHEDSIEIWSKQLNGEKLPI